METHVWLLTVALGVTAVLNWGAVARDDYPVGRITGPTFVLLLIGLAWSLYTASPPADAPAIIPLLVALGLSLFGDVLLAHATVLRFRFGLLVSAVAAGAYGWAVHTVPDPAGLPWLVAPTVLLLVLAYGRVGRRVVAAAGADRGTVFAHLLCLGALAVLAAVTRDRLVVTGGLVLVGSALLRGHDRFVLERRWAPALVMMTHHAGHVLIVVGLLT